MNDNRPLCWYYWESVQVSMTAKWLWGDNEWDLFRKLCDLWGVPDRQEAFLPKNWSKEAFGR